jgi:hypothetical protein
MGLESSRNREKETLRAIKTGQASPTISFALEQGGDVLEAFHREVKTMNATQRQAFANGVMLVRGAINGKLNSTDDFDNQWYRIFAPTIGISLGAVVEFLLGVPYSTVAGGGAGFALQRYLLGLTGQQRNVLEERLRLCDRLLKDATQA